jgi:hypothetical protein
MSKKEKNKPLLAPLYIVKEEKLYLIWFFTVIFFGLINVWAELLMGDNDGVVVAFREGIVYTYLISICAPFIAETLLNILVKLKAKEEIEFLTYQVLASGFNLFLIFFLVLIWAGSYKGIIWIQVLLGFIVSAFAFYMYCIGQMGAHKGIVGKYKDDEYLKEEKKSMKNLQEAAEEIKYIDGEEGEIEI